LKTLYQSKQELAEEGFLIGFPPYTTSHASLINEILPIFNLIETMGIHFSLMKSTFYFVIEPVYNYNLFLLVLVALLQLLEQG